MNQLLKLVLDYSFHLNLYIIILYMYYSFYVIFIYNIMNQFINPFSIIFYITSAYLSNYFYIFIFSFYNYVILDYNVLF